MRPVLRLALVLAVFTAAACEIGFREPADAGIPESDGGALDDASPRDASVEAVDASLEAVDASVGPGSDVGPGPDAAPSPRDASALPPDAAAAPPDASAAGPDTGSPPSGPRWVGRVDATDPNAVKFAWQGAGLVATVEGTSVVVKLRTEGSPTVFFQPVIDGAAAARLEVKSGADRTLTLATGLAPGDHTVELYRETEGMYGTSTFLGFTSGTVKGAPPPPTRFLEVIGDSISAGYGNLGTEPHPGWVANPACTWTAENSSWYATYAAVAGRKLGAQVSTIARSGWGMSRDRTGAAAGVLSSVWPNALGTANPSPWGFVPKVSAVVINLGTNDWAPGDPGVAYETAYLAFLDQVRAKYPDAWLFCTIGSMLGEPELSQVKARLTKVVSAKTTAGDQKIATFDFGTQDLGSDGSVPTGCDWHPNVADNVRMAGILEAQLKAKLGW